MLASGDAPSALQCAVSAFRNASVDPAWHQLRGLALGAIGRADEAHVFFRSYSRLRPDDADGWINLGNCCLECGRWEHALQAFHRAGLQGADGVPWLLGTGLALLATDRFGEAEGWLRRALALEPGAADLRLSLGQCLAELERYEELAACVATLDVAGFPFDQRITLAWLKAQAGFDEAACTIYRGLIAERPTVAAPRVQLALLLERLNQVDDAAALLRTADLPGGSETPMGTLAMARIARRRGEPVDTGALADAAKGEAPAMAAQLWFELARCHDQQERIEPAMEALSLAHASAGHALRQRRPHLAGDDVLAWLTQRLRRPLHSGAAALEGDPADPVFLVGFPRSGTTLLERMLDCHPQLHVLDERPALEDVIARMRSLPGWRDDDLAGSLDRIEPRQRRDLRAFYRSRVARHLPGGEGRLVDKYPLYLSRAAYIQALFPRSDWLLLLRHPCDCVLSCYFQAFGFNGGALAFASMEAAALTYAAVMGHWEEQRGLAAPRTHTLRYEDLAADPVAALDDVMAFLSLPTDAAQFHFHETVGARRINTPSYAQVAEPVHSRAVGRWRRYRAHFSDAALDALEPFAERYGYELD